ncbi:MAG: fimbrial protein [Serratia bockelmannii]
MKNIFKIAALSGLVMSSFSAFADTEAPTPGSLHITGTVVETTCAVPKADMTRTIPFDSTITNALAGTVAGTVLQSKSFTFSVTDCPGTASKVGMKFDYDPDPAGNYMKNTVGTGAAQGVLLGISEDGDTTAVQSGTLVGLTDVDTTSHGATIKAKVNAYREGTTFAPGSITSTANITLQYQ